MAERLPGFRGEYLWEWDVPDHHLRAIVEAIPAERFGWRPADDARSVSEVLVHIAAGNFMLLDMVGVTEPLQASCGSGRRSSTCCTTARASLRGGQRSARRGRRPDYGGPAGPHSPRTRVQELGRY